MSHAGPLNRVSLLCRAKLLFVSHEAGWPGKCDKKFPNNFIWWESDISFNFENGIFIEGNCFRSFNIVD